jgi:hypothetical protein
MAYVKRLTSGDLGPAKWADYAIAPPAREASRSWWLDAPTREELDRRVREEQARMGHGKFGRTVKP